MEGASEEFERDEGYDEQVGFFLLKNYELTKDGVIHELRKSPSLNNRNFNF